MQKMFPVLCKWMCIIFFINNPVFYLVFSFIFFESAFPAGGTGYFFYRKNSRTQNIRVIIHYINVINITVAAAKPHQPL